MIQGPLAATLSLIVLAPVLIAAGNYLLIGRLVRAVLPPSTGHRVFGVPARLLTRIFVGSDILTFFVQAAGSSVASSVDWVGSTANVGVKILIGGLALQAIMFLFFLSIFSRFLYLAKRKGLAVGDAPRGWERVVAAVYVSSAMILVGRFSVEVDADGEQADAKDRFVAFTVSPSLPRGRKGMRSATSGCSGCLSRCLCSLPSVYLLSSIQASILDEMVESRDSGPRSKVATRKRRRLSCGPDIAGTGPETEGSDVDVLDLAGRLVDRGWRWVSKDCPRVGVDVG